MSDSVASYKTLANSIARSVIAGDGDMEEYASIFSLAPETEEEINISSSPERGRLGIWKLHITDGVPVYIRDLAFKPEWHFWADVQKIPLYTSGKRIVLTGESVARGYLYDPNFNPAMALSSILSSISGCPETEVVDLARNGMDIHMLSAVCRASFELKPDVLVVFAGNNWLSSVLNGSYTAAELSGLNGIPDRLQSVVTGKLKKAVSLFVKEIAELSSLHQVPVIMIIPEYNLLDWRSSELERRMCRLSPDAALQWSTCAQKAKTALADGDDILAAEMGAALLKLDYTNPLGYEVSASCKILQQDFIAARALLEQARDTAVFGRANSSGRNLALNRELILQAGEKYKVKVIDLPAVFKEYLHGAIPGRELFLDYCHMTERGISIAMTKVADCIIREWNIDERITASVLSVGEDVQAMAHVLAAIHNSHNGQEPDIIRYHCQQAIAKSGVVKKFMALYISLATRRLPNVICKYYEEILSEGFAAQYGQGRMLLHPENQKIMDLHLVEAMTAALESAGIGIRESITALRLREHKVDNRKVNLLQSIYHRQSYQDYLGETHYSYRAVNERSVFYLVAEESVPLELILCYRTLHRCTADQLLSVIINENQVSTLSCEKEWTTCNITIEAGVLRSGINHVIINWVPGFDQDIVNERNSGVMESIYADLYPFFGEIHSFTAGSIR